MVRKILVGALESNEGRGAIEAAVAEARRTDAEIHLVGFHERPKGEAQIASYAQDTERLRAHVERIAAELVPDDVRAVSHVPDGVGRPSDAILRVAVQEGVDLIVIGMRERSRVGKLVMGSNAQDILLAAECPVLSVKPGQTI